MRVALTTSCFLPEVDRNLINDNPTANIGHSCEVLVVYDGTTPCGSYTVHCTTHPDVFVVDVSLLKTYSPTFSLKYRFVNRPDNYLFFFLINF